MDLKEFNAAKAEQGWAEGIQSYTELKMRGIKDKVEHGKNEFGFYERTIYLTDGSVWDYQPEDQYYERRH